MATISIEGMEFHAYHGCFEEEQVIGNTFMVDVHMETDTTLAEGPSRKNSRVIKATREDRTIASAIL